MSHVQDGHSIPISFYIQSFINIRAIELFESYNNYKIYNYIFIYIMILCMIAISW